MYLKHDKFPQNWERHNNGAHKSRNNIGGFWGVIFGNMKKQSTLRNLRRERRERSLTVGVVMLCNTWLLKAQWKWMCKLIVQGSSVWYEGANAAPSLLTIPIKPAESSHRFVQTKNHTNFVISLYWNITTTTLWFMLLHYQCFASYLTCAPPLFAGLKP